MAKDEVDAGAGDMYVNTSSSENLLAKEEDGCSRRDVGVQAGSCKGQEEGDSWREEESPPPPKPCCFSIFNFLSNITVEPAVFLFMLSYSMSSVVLQNFFLDNICHNMRLSPGDNCVNVSYNEADETKVQKSATMYSMYSSLIESCVSVFFALFVGPWSDLHGRKLPLVLPVVGYALNYLSLAFLAYLQHVPTPYLLLSCVPVAVTGGIICQVMAVNSYIADITTEAQRTTRLAFLQGAVFMGMPLGLYFSGIIFEAYGYVVVFCISAALNILSAIYVVVVVRESVAPGQSRRGCCVDLVDVRNVRDVFATTLKPREGPKRSWVLVLCFCIFLQVFPFIGDNKIIFLYTIKKLNWDTVIYTKFSTFHMVVSVIGTAGAIPVLSHWLRLPDVLLGFLSTLSKVGSCIVMALATTGWQLYLGSTLSLFSGMCVIVLRSMISKIVLGSELGKVFSFVASLESTLPLVATPMYTAIYNTTIDIFPGAFFIVSAGVYGVVFFFFLYIYLSMRSYARTPTYQQVAEDA